MIGHRVHHFILQTKTIKCVHSDFDVMRWMSRLMVAVVLIDFILFLLRRNSALCAYDVRV